MEEQKNLENVDTQQDAQEPQEVQAESIPPELEGIDDDEIVKEVMEEAKAQEAEPKEEPEEEPKAEPAKDEPAGPMPTSIPYGRFKEKVDEGKRKDEEIEQLKKQLEMLKAGTQQQQPILNQPNPQYQMQPAPMPQPQQVQQPQQSLFTPENMKLINDAIQREAVAMAQLSKEDMDSLEYMEDDDPRKQRWEYAKEMAKGNIFERIRQAQAQKLAEQARFLEAHNRSVQDFNSFAAKVQSEPDFEEVKNYAVNDFFKALPTQDDKAVIAAAYARIERNVASPEDIYLIKNFFVQAQNAYRSSKPKQTTTNKKEQADKFPRSNQVAGAGDAGGGVTVASLEKMLNEMPFDKIDPKYQKLLLGE